jgi:hypothetical protein
MGTGKSIKRRHNRVVLPCCRGLILLLLLLHGSEYTRTPLWEPVWLMGYNLQYTPALHAPTGGTTYRQTHAPQQLPPPPHTHTLMRKMRAGLLPLWLPVASVQLLMSAPDRCTISRTLEPEGPAQGGGAGDSNVFESIPGNWLKQQARKQLMASDATNKVIAFTAWALDSQYVSRPTAKSKPYKRGCVCTSSTYTHQ